ncbi:DNA gyrase inhibitor YacG [Neomegalonema perideroedes]|uniref:DNA gyrase inhibitor YacG n=1 Tax=Neomegalonema perideroedes TaxID=217219 RepID=UPI000369CF86|nr:DNA gyrase inhibitor YacG [Neomegalonema perideroedes]
MTELSPDQQPTGGLCPHCGAPGLRRWRPFCSKRCADLDLARWLRGDYRIPGEETDIPSREVGEGEV